MNLKRHMLQLLLLVSAVVTLNGCTYFTNRYNDLKDIGDFGVTFSSKPQLAVYASGPFVQVGALGYGHVDGHFFGMGEGRVAAWAPHYEESYGLAVWGNEWLSYFHTEDEIKAMPKAEGNKAANAMQVGIVGMALGLPALQGQPLAPPFDAPPPTLKYIGSCPHYIHLGWVGLVGTPRYFQMIDFLVGWTTLDICQDDNRDLDGVPLNAAPASKTMATEKPAAPAKK